MNYIARIMLAKVQTVNNPINLGKTYPSGVSSVCEVLVECNSSFQTEFAKRFPSD